MARSIACDALVFCDSAAIASCSSFDSVVFPGGGEEEVMFVVAKVKSVDALSQNFQRPAVTNVHDEPFTSLIALLISDRNNANFSAAHRTEWFKAGLTYAYQNDFLK